MLLLLFRGVYCCILAVRHSIRNDLFFRPIRLINKSRISLVNSKRCDYGIFGCFIPIYNHIRVGMVKYRTNLELQLHG